MLTTTVNFPNRRAPSPEIWARDTSLDGTANRSAGVNGAPNVDAGINGATHLGGQRCGDHEDRGDSTNYRELAKHNLSLPRASLCTTPILTPATRGQALVHGVYDCARGLGAPQIKCRSS